jgi:DNA invertase Pin-like site-specific DNA recombinase
MSLAAMHDKTKVEDQARISRGLAGQIHWQVAAGCGHPGADGVYTDNSRSAWQRNRKRPGWDQMLADVKAGRLDSIIVYHGDRLIRQPRDLEDLIDLAEGKGIRLAAPTGMRDLDNTDDRFVLRILVAQACMESDNTSRRRKSQYERWRREGRVRPGGRGGRAFGFATDGVSHAPPDRCVIATREVLGEVGIIREMARRVLAGEKTGAIARDVTARGWRTPTGGPFTHGTIRKMLARPRYAGLMPDGENKAAWDPVLDRATWETVCAVLDDKAAGFGFATNARRWLLSGVAVCGAPGCGSPLQISGEGRRAHADGRQCVRRRCGLEHHWEPAPGLTGYRCVRPGCRKVQRNAAHLDEYVAAAVVARLGDRRNPAGRVPHLPGPAAEFRALAAERARVEAMVRDHTKGRADLLMARLDGIDARLEQLREQAEGGARSALLARHAGITRGEFGALPLATRQSLVAACFTVVVLPGRRGPGFDSGTVRLLPPGDHS